MVDRWVNMCGTTLGHNKAITRPVGMPLLGVDLATNNVITPSSTRTNAIKAVKWAKQLADKQAGGVVGIAWATKFAGRFQTRKFATRSEHL